MPNPMRPSTYARLPAVARQDLGADFGYLVSDADLDDGDKAAMVKLVLMLTDPDDARRYPTWESRARALGVSEDKVFLYRRTPQYQKMLKEVIRTRSLESTARNLGELERITQAAPGIVTAAESVSAAKLTAEIGGAKEPVQVNSTNLNLTLEGQLKDLLRRTVDARVIEP